MINGLTVKFNINLVGIKNNSVDKAWLFKTWQQNQAQKKKMKFPIHKKDWNNQSGGDKLHSGT